MNRDDWEDFIDTVEANGRSHAGYFSWRSDRDVEEVGVVQVFHESLSLDGQPFFHTFRPRGKGNDPPDCEALSSTGERIAIEVTELVDGTAIGKPKSKTAMQSQPFRNQEAFKLLADRIARKDKPREVKGGPYVEYILIIYCDEPRVLDYNLIEYIRGCSFPVTKLLNRVFVLFSYNAWGNRCPYLELKLHGV